MFGLPELKLFAYPTIGELERAVPQYWRERGVRHRSPGLVRAVAELVVGDQSAPSLDRAWRWLHQRALWSGARMLRDLAARTAPRALVEKSPENVLWPTALERLTTACPDARFIHLVRHPVSSGRSMAEHWQRTMAGQDDADLALQCAALWLEVNQRILDVGAQVGGNRYLRLRAEDVLAQPRRQLLGVAQWLGVACDSAAIDAMLHPERSPFARPLEAGWGDRGGSDPAFLADPALRPGQLPSSLHEPPWLGHFPTLWPRVVELAVVCGYEERPSGIPR